MWWVGLGEQAMNAPAIQARGNGNIRWVMCEEPVAGSSAQPGQPDSETFMEHLFRTATTVPFAAAVPGLVAPDDDLVVRLRDRRLRALLVTAAKLSPQNQLRLAAVAQALSETEGLHQRV